MSKGGGIGIESILKKFIERYSDIKTITICTTEGTQLSSVNRQYFDGNGNYHSVPSFIVSYDQTSRLNLGNITYSIIWKDGNIIVQSKLDLIVISILFDENANLGLLEEFLPLLTDTLRPFCAILTS